MNSTLYTQYFYSLLRESGVIKSKTYENVIEVKEIKTTTGNNEFNTIYTIIILTVAGE